LVSSVHSSPPIVVDTLLIPPILLEGDPSMQVLKVKTPAIHHHADAVVLSCLATRKEDVKFRMQKGMSKDHFVKI